MSDLPHLHLGEGINGQMSASEDADSSIMNWMMPMSVLRRCPFKVHSHHEHVFPRAHRQIPQAIGRHWTSGRHVSHIGEHVSPEKWKECSKNAMISPIVLDVRNDYEWEVGHFDGADCRPCETFREFREYARRA